MSHPTCPDCEGLDHHLTPNPQILLSDEGLGLPDFLCLHCGAEFDLCIGCDGDGFEEDIDDPDDCPLCDGVGHIERIAT